MNLFDHAHEKRLKQEQPLAARMRPRSLDEYVGQEHILAPGRLLRRAIQADRVSSLIFYGPPGTGKTTLASVIANTTQSWFEQLNAVLAGVADIRRVTKEAQQRYTEHGRRTILFVDEVHRWNKAQQDALLPWVENGTVILIGATTENPFFTVNPALVSRSRIFQLKPMTEPELKAIAEQALADDERGYGTLDVHLDGDAMAHLIDVANGDARAVLNALELAVETTPPAADGQITITLPVAEESIQRRAVLYDKEGDYHFDTISAFIKSLRGSDPDAALYWLAKMVYAGEDPKFLFRRMLIFCGEDIGMADPQAMTVCSAAAQAFERVGMPEGNYHLGFAAAYLATAPKSNSVMGFFDALAAVEKEKEAEVPNHLRDASRDAKGFGHGKGYLYPHAYRDHWVAQQYLPNSLQGKVFYQPGTVGFEKHIAEEVQRRREAQLAAIMDDNLPGAPPEILTYSPADKNVDRWLSRTVSGIGERLADLRDDLFDMAQCQRHWRVLDCSADSGLFTWEALRLAPEGGVWSLTSTETAAEAIREQAQALPAARRPVVITGSVSDLPGQLRAGGDDNVRFELVVGKNALTRARSRQQLLDTLADLLATQAGRICLVESIPKHTQRLYRLARETSLDADLVRRWQQAEEAIYSNPDDPMVNWDLEDLGRWFKSAGLEITHLEERPLAFHLLVGEPILEQWFGSAGQDGRPSYAQHLEKTLASEEVKRIETLFRTRLLRQTVPWTAKAALVSAVRSSATAPQSPS